MDEISKYGSVLGLENMRELLVRLGNPQEDLKFIHISGTNGKGSVLAYLSTILSGAGYRTGRYISPTLFSYRERIQVDEKEIEKDALARHVTAISQAVKDMEAVSYTHLDVYKRQQFASAPQSAVICAVSCVWHSISGTLIAGFFASLDKKREKAGEAQEAVLPEN